MSAASGELVDGGNPAKNRAVSLAVGASELGACGALSANMSTVRTAAIIVRLVMDTISSLVNQVTALGPRTSGVLDTIGRSRPAFGIAFADDLMVGLS